MSDTPASTSETPAEKPHGSEEGKPAEAPTVEELLAKVEELTGHSRKWEDRAKANKEAADRLAEIERDRMTDAEKAEADRASHAQDLADAIDRADKAEAALARFTVATEFGLSKEDAEALASVSDPDALRALAERLGGAVKKTPRPIPGQGKGGNAPAASTKAAFADALEALL